MKAYTWKLGKITRGLELVADERLGQVVFLGESCPGQRYEKVALARRNPAEVTDGKVLEAKPVGITLPARDGKLEKKFYVLERPSGPDNAVLMRVNTRWVCTRDTGGGWSRVEGSPEDLVSGHGAHGDAGRIGSWADGLVIMHPGDVLRIRPEGGHKVQQWALWLEDGEPKTLPWSEYEALQAAEAAASSEPEGLTGLARCFTFHRGVIRPGVEVSDTATGPAL